ncbi:hypothetical protein L1785_03290 [Antribacter sp. KLBMP9083]|uniref:TolB-like translocation protein n=1 Tax=Antribacter soli TaxID=2910976 RepID=A0AA41QD71_9MICO|nr:hypothetical protein [Antribacter soli]MCF4119994.1 hypothetical protein [Antribacter soli]
MTVRARVAVFAVLVIVVLTAVAGFATAELRRSQAERSAPSDVATTMPDAVTGPRLVFRSTAPGDLYGLVAAVPLDDLAGPRAVASVACDRVDATDDAAVCLRTVRGVVTTFEAQVLDAAWQVTESWPLPGVPSRTRFSPDGTLVSTTSFVTGHSYATTGFSTETVVRTADGADPVNLEDFALFVDGAPAAPVDRNVWGVTFVDDTSFYATVQSRSLGRTWLVRGDLAARTLTTVLDGVECPSLSPDGTRIAFKHDTDPGTGFRWAPAVLDVATLDVTVLEAETRDVDDQIAWLDDETLLYGLPRADQPGLTDVWSLPADGSGTPEVAVPEAWSPAVVRG